MDAAVETLPPEEVRERLRKYDRTGLDFARQLVSSVMDRNERRFTSIEQKANLTLGLALGLLGAVAAWVPEATGWPRNAYFMAAAAGATAALASFAALRMRDGWPELADDTIFPDVPSGKPFELEAASAWWITNLQIVQAAQWALCDRKSKGVVLAQWSLIAGVFALALGRLFA